MTFDELLLRCFQPRELEIELLARKLQVGAEVTAWLPPAETTPAAVYMHEAAGRLTRLGLLEAAITALYELRPQHADDIRALEEARQGGAEVAPRQEWLIKEAGPRSDGQNIRVRVGAKHTHESNLLCQLIATVISEVPGYRGVPHFDTGPYLTNYLSLISGYIDLYLDYSGTIYELYLGIDDYEEIIALQEEERSRRSIDRLRSALAAQQLPPQASLGSRLDIPARFDFTNNWQLLIRKAFAEEHQIPLNGRGGIDLLTLLSASHRAAWSAARVCGYDEFRRRSDGLERLEHVARASVKSFTAAGPSERYCLLNQGECDIVDGYQTDPQCGLLIEQGVALPVHDNIPLWPIYSGVILTRSSFLEAHPEVAAALRRLDGVLRADMLSETLEEIMYEGRSSFEDFEHRCQTGLYPTDLRNLDVGLQMIRFRRAAEGLLQRLFS